MAMKAHCNLIMNFLLSSSLVKPATAILPSLTPADVPNPGAPDEWACPPFTDMKEALNRMQVVVVRAISFHALKYPGTYKDCANNAAGDDAQRESNLSKHQRN